MSRTLSAQTTKTLLASSAIVFALLAGHLGAQAQGVVPPTAGTSRQIQVVPGTPGGDASQPEIEQRVGAPTGPQADAPGDPQADIRADAPDGAQQESNVANGAPDGPSDAPPVGALQRPIEAAPTTTATAPVMVDPKPTISEETKRKNRQRYIERYEERQYVEPRHRYREPRYVEREYVEPRYVAPRPRYVEPRYVEPRYERYAPPRYYEPRREYYGPRGGY